jgi:predicted nucleotidyltransferase
MTTTIAKNATILKKRVERFLNSDAYARSEIKGVIDHLKAIGSVAIFGGALRDLALEGNRHFPSDVDLVVDPNRPQDLETLMKRFNAKRNKHGGYRFSLTRWKFDVWSLETTWAIRNRLVHGHNIEDLLKTTFFDWDAIAYDVSSRRLYAPATYFQKISERVVDINLKQNPNPTGNAARALRIYQSGAARLSPALARYALETLNYLEAKQHSPDRSKGVSITGSDDSALMPIAEEMKRALQLGGDLPIGKIAEQLPL